MIIAGKWLKGEDGITRPVVIVHVQGAAGSLHEDVFLVDTGADCTVLSAAFLSKLQLPTQPAPRGVKLEGVSGQSSHVVVQAALEFSRDDGGSARVRGEFAAFTAATASDFSILGRDVLDNFDVIISRRCNTVLLVSGNHQYVLTRMGS